MIKICTMKANILTDITIDFECDCGSRHTIKMIDTFETVEEALKRTFNLPCGLIYDGETGKVYNEKGEFLYAI